MGQPSGKAPSRPISAWLSRSKPRTKRRWQRAKLESAKGSPFPLSPSLRRPIFYRTCGRDFPTKPKTLAYYEVQTGHLVSYPALANAPVDAVPPAVISGFVAKWRAAEYEVSSTNRALQVLRRMLRLAVEWGKAERAAPRVALLPGERQRERVLNPNEETAYLNAAQAIGESILEAYKRALAGIRATARGERPIEPEDPYLLRDVS